MIRLTILVCFPREDEQVPVDWERETRELIHLPGVEEVFWGQNYQGEANYDAVAMIDFKNERAYHRARKMKNTWNGSGKISKSEGFACLCTEIEGMRHDSAYCGVEV